MLFAACSRTGKEDGCVPQCSSGFCGDDGCGATCACPDGETCEDNRCSPIKGETPCVDNNIECGEFEGIVCGVCLAHETCRKGICICEPVCDDVSCGADQCGGFCDCMPGELCTSAGICIDDSDCTETCDDADVHCGFLCGANCGECEENDACVDGDCVCVPRCDGTSCNFDGCEGTCPCPGGLSCSSTFECIDANTCDDTCESSGHLCGEVCGETCGVCAEGDVCRDGVCHCNPLCDGSSCGADGCGGVCACPDGTTCDSGDICVSETVCDNTCLEQGKECGTVCGEDCGSCGDGQNCSEGVCICQVDCDDDACGINACGGNCFCEDEKVCDGSGRCVVEGACADTCEEAGATCGTVCGRVCGDCSDIEDCISGECHPLVSCDGCPLVLFLYRRDVNSSRTVLSFSVRYQPLDNVPRARVFDIYLKTDPPMTVASANEGAALLSSGKRLSIDRETGEKWSTTSIGVARFSALSLESTAYFEAGQLFEVTYESTANLIGTAISLSIDHRNQVLAPEDADMVLQITPYDMPLNVIIE